MRHAVLTALALGALLPATALAGAAAGPIKWPEVPLYDDDGNLVCRIKARKVTPDPNNAKVLRASAVSIFFHYQGRKHVATGDAGVLDTENKNASLEGNVTLTLAHERPITVKTARLRWFAAYGLATTETPDAETQKALAASKNPTAIFERLVARSATRVAVSTVGAATEGFGMLVAVGQVEAPRKEPGRSDHLVLGRQIHTTIRSANASWLLRDPDPQPEGDKTAPAEDAPRNGAAAPKPAAKPQTPIVVTCSGPLTLHRDDSTAVYHNNVRVAQGGQSLTCDTLTIAFRGAEGAQPELDTVTAHGQVRIDTGEDLALADLAAWHRRDGFALLTGRPAKITWDNGNEIVAGRIRRKTRRVGGRDEFDWLDCAATPAYSRSVYLVARAATARIPALPERRHAPPQAPQDR